MYSPGTDNLKPEIGMLSRTAHVLQYLSQKQRYSRILPLLNMAWPTIPIVAVLFLLNRHVSAVPSCRFIPGDEGWPSQSDWDRLNRTVRGRLIATVPLASVCHTPTYSETACDSLKQQWDLSPTQ